MDALVSVLVPIYSPGPVIERCFESIRKQTYNDLEVIPIDDAGPEPIRDILTRYAIIDSRWKPIYHETNRGLAASLNDGFRASAGSYVLILEQDCELVNPDALERAVAIGRTHPRWCLSGSWRLPYSEMRPIEVAFAAIRNHVSDMTSKNLAPKAFMELKCDMIPREALVAANGFDDRLRTSGEDQVLSLRLRRLGWEIVTTTSLEITLRSGTHTGFRSNLRKAFLYGHTQAAVLRRGARELIAGDIGIGQGRERLVNRFLAVVSGASIYVLAPLLILVFVDLASIFIVLPIAIIPIIRSVLVMSRALRLRGKLTNRWRVGLLTFLLCPIDDLVYTAALGLGMLKRKPNFEPEE